MNKNVIAVIDGAAGSCGKAKVCGEIATSENIGASVTNSMPNAGQTFVSEDGKKYLFKNVKLDQLDELLENMINKEEDTI